MPGGKIMNKLIVIVTVLLIASSVSAFDIVIENIPSMGVPKDAMDRECKEIEPLGTLKELIHGSISMIRVRYFSGVWPDENSVKAYVSGIMTDKNSRVYCCQPWAHLVMEPDIEGLICYENFKSGEFRMWNSVACIQGPDGKWLFVINNDYAGEHYPYQGSR